jgi:hypothetical protein
MIETDGTGEYHGPDVPAEVGEALATALDLPHRPETVGDWARAMARVVEREDVSVRPETLCTTSRSPHKAHFGNETQHYRCVQDAFIIPYLIEDVDTLDITTECPESGTRIEITVTDDGVEVEPSGGVMSIGVADDVTEPDGDADTPVLAYERICPYGHAFSNRRAYAEWAESVDAVTMVAPVEHALHFARTLVHATRSN